LFQDSRRVVASAQRADGVVTRIEWVTTTERGRTSSVAYPFVQFQAEGRTVEFRSDVGSSPPSYSVGERVTVLYQPDKLEQARLEGYFQQYLGPLIVGGVGLIVSLVGVGLLVVLTLGARRRRKALEMGVPVQAKVIEVRQTGTVVVGRPSWVIVAEYRDANLDRTFAFTSHNIWINPQTYYPIGSDITVYYLPDKPSVYAFQLGKLPEALE
jgi:hypothetical protein